MGISCSKQEADLQESPSLTAFAQALTLGEEVARLYAEAITLLRGLENSPMDAAALVGLDAAGLHQLNEVLPYLWTIFCLISADASTKQIGQRFRVIKTGGLSLGLRRTVWGVLTSPEVLKVPFCDADRLRVWKHLLSLTLCQQRL